MRGTPKTVSGRQFVWGGTSVKWQRRCPKAGSAGTETWLRAKGQKPACSRSSARKGTWKQGPIDPFLILLDVRVSRERCRKSYRRDNWLVAAKRS
ncbi:hypothetical protein TNIN_430281 [Trichonephila inaurata madagascariensis]|uniref:Uncharacterized protein n=1 Tax=Trichonephila inaurata madagascariensis TaxID=2747483 RepID=A0A8X6MJM0_9ARAC|nr:hypothetical protein TNIN_430281 [Trichonephila inaurata madagascariensis]